MDEARAPRRLAGKLASRLRRRADEPAPTPGPPLTDPAPAVDHADRSPENPLVSVVVPVYAVEQYIDECLTSILGQTYPHLEVVIVDDGSPDGSMDIVARHAAADDRVRIVRQQNAGLGAARNTGIREARGDLITFVDSDDTLPETALAHHVRSLVRSGSDFSVGALERQQHESSYVQKPWSRRLHEVARRGVTLSDVPEALANIFACTKVFRREFVEATGLQFPVGVRYEDQVPITRAYLAATAFDILPDVVYRWRSRRDGSSITQQKARKDDLHDRLLAVDEVARLVRAQGSRTVLQSWYGKVFEFDLIAYIRASVDADDTYYATLAETVSHILDGAPPEAWTVVDLRHRIAAWALVHEGRDTLTRLLETPLLTGNLPVRRVGDGLEADTAALGIGPDVPAELLAVTDKDLLVEARLEDLEATDDQLTVWGVAFTRYVDASLPHRVGLTLQRRGGGEPVTVPAQPEHVADANVFADRLHEDHRDDGFVVRVPLADVVARSEGARTVWHTRVACDALGGNRSAVFGAREEHGAVLHPQRVLVGDALVEATWSDRLGLVLAVRTDWVALDAVEPVDDGLALTLRAAPGVTPRALLVQQDRIGEPAATGSGTWRVTLTAADVPDPGAGRRFMVDTGDGRQPLALLTGHRPAPLPGSGLVLMTGDGVVRLAPLRGVLETDSVVFDGDRARLGGSVVGEAPAELVLDGPRARVTGAVHVDGDRWTADLPLTRPSYAGDATARLPRDPYRVTGGDDVSVLAAPGSAPRRAVTRHEVPEWLAEAHDGGQLVLERTRGAEVETHTRHGQQVVQTGPYAAALLGARRPLVVFDSFVGRGFHHGAGAVARALAASRPDLELVWGLRDEALTAPAGTTPVSRQSAAWFDALATASHVVTNGTMPRFFEKAAGQRLIELWTGTPVVRFGHAVAVDEGRAAGVRALDRDVAQWDVLCTGGPAGTAWMREATGFAGEVREVGHPALDAYRAPDLAARAADVRRRLGIGDGPVLLHAPTTRHAVRAHTRREKVNELEVETLQAAVPGLTVLLRGHPNTANRRLLSPTSGVVDVTLYPELSDLVLAADAVVSDYSTLCVDVLASPTPLALFVPDRADFEELGLFPDLFGTPPGPVAESTEELVPWLVDGLGTVHPGRGLLAGQLLPLDDGHAAQRLVDAEWG